MLRRLTLILTWCCASAGCLFDRLTDDAEIANEIVAEVGGNGGRLFYSESQLDVRQGEEYSILLEIDDIPMIKNGSSETRAIASYCAHQLYVRLDPTTIQKNYGIGIRFKDEVYLNNRGSHFYTMQDLAFADAAIDQANLYLESVTQANQTQALSLFDTSFYAWSSDTLTVLNDSLRSMLTSSVIRTESFFAPQDPGGDTALDQLFPMIVLCVAVLDDGRRVKTDFIFNNIEEMPRMVLIRPHWDK
jgi:hypothetical protein